MDKKNYITEDYCQINNYNHYEKVNEPIYPRTAFQIMCTLNKLKSTGAISEKQFQFLSPSQDPRPQYLYMLPKIHKEDICWTIPNVMPPGRPIVSDCNSE